MKRLLPIFLAFIIALSPCYSEEEEEVVLQLYDYEPYVAAVEEEASQAEVEKTLKEKLADIYYLEIERTDKPAFLLSEITTKRFEEDSIWEKVHLWSAYSGNLGMNFVDDEKFGANYSFDYINLGLDGKLKNDNGDFRIMLNVSPLSSRNFAQALFADMYVATNKIPHHRVWLGNTRPPVGMEGGYSPFLLPFIARSQISRNFGTVRKLGARVNGDYSFVDYDLGVYSSDTYFEQFFPGTEFVGWLNFKPLAKFNDKYGKLILGGGLQTGQRSCDYTVTGAYLGYEYKKLWVNFEWSDANGYNGPIGYSVDKHASGFYSTLAYKLTPKVQALLRYDQFDPNKDVSKNNRREYVAGINYFVKGQALKLMMNYVFCQNDSAKNSHRLILGTQILL